MARKRKERLDSYNDPFPTRLRDLLSEQNLSHQTFGEYLGVARQSVGNYCDGSVSPGIDTVVMVADYFHVSTDYLLGQTDNRSVEADMQAACKETGLSEKMIRIIGGYCKDPDQAHRSKCLEDIAGVPDFAAVISLMDQAWHCSQRARESYESGKQHSDDALQSALALIESSGYHVSTWEESAQSCSDQAIAILKMILSSVVGNWNGSGMGGFLLPWE